MQMEIGYANASANPSAFRHPYIDLISSLSFFLNASNTPSVVFASTGYVGIGSSSPINALDIGSTQGIHLAAGTPTNTGYALYNVGGTLYWNGSSLASGGSGTVNSGTQYQMAYYPNSGSTTTVGGNSGITTDANNDLVVAPSTSSTASTVRFSYTGAADTALTTTVEAPDVYFNMGQTRQHATGALTLQRDFRITGSNHSFVGASTITNAAALAIDGPPKAGTNATITNSTALYIPTLALSGGTVTNSYGLNVTAASGGTNNYAAAFMGGNVGVGTASPQNSLHIFNSTAAAVPVYIDASSTGGGGNGGLSGNVVLALNAAAPVISFSENGTDNSSIGTTPGAYGLTFNVRNGGSYNQIMQVGMAGGHVVGIMTATPQSTLSVSGGVAIGTTYAGTNGAADNNLLVQGSVGIGSTTPIAALDVAGTSRLIGQITTNITGSTQCLHVSTTGVISGTGSDCGGGGGSGTVNSGTQYQMAYYAANGTAVSGNSGIITDANNDLIVAPSTSSTASTVRFSYTGAADTALTASTEAPDAYFNMGQTRQHATGALTLQRDFRITGSNHSFVGASTITNAAALAIDGPPKAGTNATITNSTALYIPTLALSGGTVTNSYGLNVAAASGATNNYAAIFTGGGVGIATTAPNAPLTVGTNGASLFPIITNSTASSPNKNSGVGFDLAGVFTGGIFANDYSTTHVEIISAGSGVVNVSPGLTVYATTYAQSGQSVSPNTSFGCDAIAGATFSVEDGGCAPNFAVVTAASAVDYIQITGGTTGNPGKATISSVGSDTNINMILTPKGTGKVGIGTALPGSLLSVYGGGLAVGTYAATTAVGVGSAAFSGFVGIGSATPINALDVGVGQGIRLAAGTPASTGYALYNVGGTLYWNGSSLAAGGSGTVNSGTQYQMAYYATSTAAVSGNSGIITDANNDLIVAPSASSTAATVRFSYTGAADTTLTTLTEAPDVYFNMGQTRQHATGAIATQRDFRITGSTHSFVGASTITNAAALALDGPPVAGTNATITNSSALYIPTLALSGGTVTNSYGLNVAATTGATKNYAAAFTGGNVGIGTATPLSTLSVYGGGLAVGTYAGTTTVGVGSAAFGGNVYVGVSPTKNSGYALDVNGPVFVESPGYQYFDATVSAGSADLYFNSASNYGTIGNDVSNEWSLGWSTGPGNAWTPVLAWTTSGSVGIGSTAPMNALDIGTSQGIHIAPGTPTNTGYALYNNAGTLTWNGVALGGGGSGTVNSGTQYQMAYYATSTAAVSGNSGIITDANNDLLLTPSASSTAATVRHGFTGAADTALTTLTEAPDIYFNMGQTRQHATGAIATQRDFRITGSNHSFVGGSTIANAAALAIDGPPKAGTNATITNSSALYIPTLALSGGTVTNSYGLNVAAASGGTRNYAAYFSGGNVGIGSATPIVPVDVSFAGNDYGVRITGTSGGCR